MVAMPRFAPRSIMLLMSVVEMRAVRGDVQRRDRGLGMLEVGEELVHQHSEILLAQLARRS